MSKKFDFENALKLLQESQPLTGNNGILTPLIKQLTEAALSAKLDSYLANDIHRNGKNAKTTKTTSGILSLKPREIV